MSSTGLHKLVEVMAQLRDPNSGCPWDLKQTYKTIIPYTIEETYEVVDAIERHDMEDLKGELGDLLFQVVFYCQLAKEEGHFAVDEVIDSVCTKLISRHPHVFADESYESEQALIQAWENQKHQERKNNKDQTSFLDDIPESLPALARAEKVQKRAAKQGFDWNNIEQVWEKVYEEIDELKHEEQVAQPEQTDKIEDELGDLMFALVNLSRHYKLNAESALRRATKKFESRFRKMEQQIDQEQKTLSEMTLDEMEQQWQQAKRVKSQTK